MRIYALLLLLSLTACDEAGGLGKVDAKKFLSGLEGPKVPTVSDTLLESAKNAESQGDYVQAGTFYQQALEKQPDNLDIMYSFAESVRRSGDNDRAIAMFDSILQKDPNRIAAKESKALALMAKGDFDTPGVLFGDVLKVDATRWKTLNGLGILFSTRSMQSEAQAYYMEALKYNPDSPTILNNLGLSQGMDKKFDEAIDNLLKASARTPVNSLDRKRIDLNLSLVYAIAGKLDDARAIAERYFTGANLNNNLGLYAHLAKDDQLAKAYLNMALTDSKVFYEKAWGNLQLINGAEPQAQSPLPQSAPFSTSEEADTAAPVTLVPPVVPATEPEAKPVEKPAEKPKAKPKAKAKIPAPTELPESKAMDYDDITNIINSDNEKRTAK